MSPLARFPGALPAALVSRLILLEIERFCSQIASFSKTVVGATPLPWVRIPPPPYMRAKAPVCRGFLLSSLVMADELGMSQGVRKRPESIPPYPCRTRGA